MSRSGKHIYTKQIHIYFNMPNCLNSVCMKYGATGMCNSS